MANVAARLNNTGTFYANPEVGVVFDEVTKSAFSISQEAVYAGELDEVTGTDNGRAMQQLNTGRLKISGVFDEVTGIS